MEDLPEELATSGALDVAQALCDLSVERVLDVGTGRGDFISILSGFLDGSPSFTGIDLDTEDFEEGRKAFEGHPVELLEMDAAAMDFADGSFDMVCISNSLHHIEDVPAVLGEMFRVLRPGGVFILQEMFSDGEQTGAQVNHILTHHWSARVDNLEGTYHRETLKREEIRSSIGPLGLRDLQEFEITHNIKCLDCEDRFKCVDPMDPDIIADEVEDIEEDLEFLEELEDRGLADGLAEEGRALIDRIREGGTFPASVLFFIGRK